MCGVVTRRNVTLSTVVNVLIWRIIVMLILFNNLKKTRFENFCSLKSSKHKEIVV